MISYLNIKSATVRISPGVITSPVANTTFHKKLISAEAELRRSAYSKTSIRTDEAFFNNSDMISDYFLLVIYNKKTLQPFLSARYYFDKTSITKCLKGESNVESVCNLEKFHDNEVFLIDRMSANLSSVLYRKYRNHIHQLFNLELLSRTKGCKILAMARREKNEKLLAAYHRIGLNVIGSVMHKNKEHWILFGDMDSLYHQLKVSVLQRIVFLIKSFFKF